MWRGCALLAVLPLLLLLSSSSTPAATAQEVMSIGGFVTVSKQLSAAIAAQQQQAPDLQSVRIQLFSTAGVKVAEGDCSPNGYYFVPVDNPGSYTVRVHGSQGWVFQPQETSVSCDSSSCNGGADVNFEVAGVELSGHLQAGPVASSCKANTAPSFAGITISAQAAAGRKDGRPLTATTSSVGTFSVGPLLPGDYAISAAHPHWQLGPASMSHRLSLDSPQLAAPFSVLGFSLSGAVTARSGPVAGIQVTLLSADDVSVGCSATSPPGHVSGADIDSALSNTPLCSVTTDAQGRYTFKGVPCGQYTLQASHPDTDSAFEIQPPSLSVAVGQGDTAVTEEFVVTGFSVSGRVVDSAGSGVPSVSILVDGKERATTDLNGRYVLARMQEGKTDISAEKQHFEFSSLSAVSITPSAQVLPDISVKKLGICGRLTYGDLHFKKNSKKVTLTAVDGTGLNLHTLADDFNRWCFMVPAPGRYRVAPYVSADDRAKGLVVAPTHSDVSVVGEPVTDLCFGQAKLNFHGSVLCLDGACPDDLMVVVHVASTGTKILSGKVGNIPPDDPATVTDGGRGYSFHRVRPGNYLVSAVREGWCWEGSSLPASVGQTDGIAPDLKHKGYELQVETNQPVDLVIIGDEGSPVAPFEVSLPQGSSTVCLPSTGSYILTPRGCYIFGSKSYSVTVSRDAPTPPLRLTAMRAFVDGIIRVTPSSSSSGDERITSSSSRPNLPPRIEIGTITAEPADSVAEAGVVATASQLNPETEPGVYTYTLALDLGSTVMIEPVQPDGGALIFQPTRTRYQLLPGAKGCPERVPEIGAHEGVVVAGTTKPPVAVAQVKVLYATPSALAHKAAGDLASRSVTRNDGSFAVGPLPSDATYSVEVSKAGHVLQLEESAEDGSYLFSSKQLAQVAVSVSLPAGADPAAVFLSLSGSGGFKHNARLGPDRTILFQGLQPGTYYLKPLLREHSFEPPVADVQLDDGQQLDLELTAVRTAWGISGAVASVGGAPLPGAVVEACRGDSGVVLDSALADDSGSYRVGNLKPGNTYLMRVKLDGRVVSSHPAAKKVTLGSTDVSGVDFTAFRTSARSSLTAALSPQLPAPLRASVKAELFPASSAGVQVPGSNPAAGAVFDGAGFLELRGIKQGSYVLKLSCGPAAAGGLGCEPWEKPVQVASKDVHLGVLPFQPSAAAAAGSSPTAAGAPGAAAAQSLSEEGLDWKLPVIVLVLFVAASATVLRPAVVDILQLKPLPPPTGSAAEPASSGKGAQGYNGGGSSSVAAVSRAAVAAAAAVPVPDTDSEWASDADQRSLGVVKGRAPSIRSRASRRA